LAFGMGLQLLPLEGVAEEAAFALTGMAGMVTGVMHGPLTGIFLVMETTRGYSLILPLMLTASVHIFTSTHSTMTVLHGNVACLLDPCAHSNATVCGTTESVICVVEGVNLCICHVIHLYSIIVEVCQIAF